MLAIKHIRNEEHKVEWDSNMFLYKSTDFIKHRIVESALIKHKDNFSTSD